MRQQDSCFEGAKLAFFFVIAKGIRLFNTLFIAYWVSYVKSTLQ